MSDIFIPKKRIIQPNQKPDITAVLNTDHPLAQGLVGCWLMNEGGGLTTYDYSGNDLHGTLVGGPTWAAGTDGGAVHFSADGQRIETASVAVTPEISVTVRARWDGGALKGLYYIGSLSSSAGTLFMRTHSDNTLWATDVTTATSPIATGRTYSIAYVAEIGQPVRIYLDGALYAVGSSTFSGFAATAYPRRIGVYFASTYEWNGTIESVAEYDRVLTADEVAWQAAEPYAMFENPTDKYISLPSSSSTTQDASYSADVMITADEEVYEADIAIGILMREDWGATWPIEINANSVISSDVTDWPCLITDIHFTEEAWQYIESDGRDLRFTSDEYGFTELYFDLVRIDVANKSAHIYVRIPNLNSDSNTTIYAWVGNKNAVAKSAAWMQGTYPAAVRCWHATEEGSGTTVADRTSNANHLSSWTSMTPTWTTEPNGKAAVVYPGTGYGSTVSAAMAAGAAATFAVRFYLDTAGEIYPYIGNKNSGWKAYYGWYLRLWIGNFIVQFKDDANNSDSVTAGQLSNQWVTVASSKAADGTLQIAVNGVTTSKASAVTGTMALANRSLQLGTHPVPSSYLTGAISHSSITDAAWSADQFALHHLMLSAPATFASAGDTEIIIPIYHADVDIKVIQDKSYSADIKLVKDINYEADVMIEPLPALLIPRRKVIQPNQKPDIGVQLNTDHPLAQGLVGYWLMNEGTGNITQDLSGNSKHAAFYNSTTWRTGQLGSLYFDGSNDYIAADEAVITGATDATWVVRAYIPRQYIGIRNCVIMSQRTGGNGYTFCWSMDLSSYDATGRCRFYDRTWSDNINLYSQSEIWNAWHTIVVRRRGIVFDIFIDGQLDNTGAAPTIVDYQNWRWSMGWSLRESNYATVMLADFAAVYKRALSDEQIVTLQFEPYSMLKYPTKRYISITQDIGPTRNISYLSDTVKIKEDNDTSYSADILLQIETDVFYNSDVILRTEHNISYSSDVIPQKQETENYYADIIARTQNDISYEADTLAQEQEIVIYYTDIGVRGTIDVTYSSEGLLQKQSDISYSAEADVIVIREYYANIYMTKTNNVILYFADVILKVLNNSLSYAADSAIYNIFSSTYSSDIYIREARYSLVDTLARKVLSLNNIEAGASSIEMSAASGTEDTVEAVREDNTVNIIAFNTEYIEIILSMKSTSTTTIPEEAESHSLQIEAAVNILEKTTINEVNATRTAVPDGTEVVFEVEGEDSVNAMVNPITAKTNAGKAETSLVVITPIGTDKVDVTVRAYLNQF